MLTILFVNLSHVTIKTGEVRMAQWWEQSPPVTVARISHPCIDTIIWVEFVVSSLPCSERYSSGTPAFFSPQKPTLPNSPSTRNQVDEDPKVDFVWNGSKSQLVGVEPVGYFTSVAHVRIWTWDLQEQIQLQLASKVMKTLQTLLKYCILAWITFPWSCTCEPPSSPYQSC